jgi:hypothetical protein
MDCLRWLLAMLGLIMLLLLLLLLLLVVVVDVTPLFSEVFAFCNIRRRKNMSDFVLKVDKHQ